MVTHHRAPLSTSYFMHRKLHLGQLGGAKRVSRTHVFCEKNTFFDLFRSLNRFQDDSVHSTFGGGMTRIVFVHSGIGMSPRRTHLASLPCILILE